MKYDYHVAIIGAGSAGLVVASGCANIGAKVALFEKDKMGGDCLNFGCVPSKSFLRSAHIADFIKNSEDFGIESSINKIDITKVMKRVKSVIDEIAPHDSKERYEKLGVDVFSEEAFLADNHTIKTDNINITAKYIVIATGSGPLVPPIPGLKDVPYLTNKNIFNIQALPEHLIVLGGGPIGLELGQGFRHLGSDVTIIDMLPSIFPKDDPEVAPILEKHLIKDGLKLEFNSKIIEVVSENDSVIVVIEKDNKKEKITGDAILVSLGRIPSNKNLGLEIIGINTDKKGYIITDKTLKTSVNNIYACGDVVGPYQFTHMAGYQAGIVVRNIILPIKSKVNYSTVPWVTYTKPEVAHVGYTEPWAKSEGIYAEKVVISLAEMDRAKAENDKDGFLKLILGKKNKIIGATMVGEKAGEMIAVASLAIREGLSATNFAGQIFSYPTESEIYKFASYELLKKSLKPWVKKLINILFLR